MPVATASQAFGCPADLPTAFAVADELRDGTMVGQCPSGSDDVEQFGIGLREDATPAQLEQQWLTDAG